MDTVSSRSSSRGRTLTHYAYLHHQASLEHDTGAHPECSARIEAIESQLADDGFVGYQRIEAARATRSAIEAVHPGELIESIERISSQGGGMLDVDTITSTGSYEAALRAAGANVQAVDLLLSGEAVVTFCGLRPPGHHATRDRSMGFCLFNNVAIAARHAIDQYGLERVLVLDWDVHHGNGTNDIFYDTDQVLYVSIHQSPLYPGSGALTENGSGAGTGYTINLPADPGSSDPDWLGLFSRVVAPIARQYRPQLLLVSAGYDAHEDDPLADCNLNDRSYAQLAGAMRALSDETSAPLGFTLEGGYDLDALSRSVQATLAGAKVAAPLDEPEVTVTVSRAIDHYRAWWQFD